MAALTCRTTVSDSFMIPGNENGTPNALRRLAAGLTQPAVLCRESNIHGLDLTTLKVSVEHGELVLVSVSTREGAIR